jgi:hypothetical protein
LLSVPLSLNLDATPTLSISITSQISSPWVDYSLAMVESDEEALETKKRLP